MQETLAFLTGDRKGYDPADWRTNKGFPTGHFAESTKLLVHLEKAKGRAGQGPSTHKTYIFEADAFRGFVPTRLVDPTPVAPTHPTQDAAGVRAPSARGGRKGERDRAATPPKMRYQSMLFVDHM
mmetsp:Transcript_37392/g.83674  ORF Transcript_37392/g.83674 Transcript_37392/m.83674 type:complete len:125 (+) Transcript_37392:345-719(+)